MTRKQIAILKRRKLTRRYLELRAKYAAHGTYTAQQGLYGARNTITPIKPLDWDSNTEHATWKDHGFTLHARVKYDDSPDLSYLGEVSTTWKPGAVTIDPHDDIARNERGRHDDRPVYFHTESGKGTREFLHYRGVAKGPAEEYARECAHEEFRRYRSLMNNDWDYVGIVVTAYRKGIKLGSASVWGIERYGRNTPGFEPKSDCTEYFTETAYELAHEAIKEAKDAIEGLQKRRSK